MLWAFITYDPITTTQEDVVFLKLAPAVATVKKGKAFTITVTNARTGAAVENATVGDARTDVKGKATLSIPNKGFYQFKASRPLPSVRSNVLNVTVT